MTGATDLRSIAFICGCGHSGTTLLATMLAMNPDIFVPLVETAIFLEPDEHVVAEKVAQLKRAALASGKPVLVEKTPRHIHHLDRIRTHIPGAKAILMVRDGRDVATSIGKRTQGNYGTGVRRWVKENRIVAAEMHRQDVLVVKYEDLIVDAAAELGKVCEFLGVTYTPQMLAYHQREHLWFGKTEVKPSDGVGVEHTELRNWQVNQPMFDGRGRWRDTLPAEFVELFREGEAVELMHLFGYQA